MTLPKTSGNRRSFPNDEAVIKVMYLAGQLISRKWTMLMAIGVRR